MPQELKNQHRHIQNLQIQGQLKLIQDLQVTLGGHNITHHQEVQVRAQIEVQVALPVQEATEDRGLFQIIF